MSFSISRFAYAWSEIKQIQKLEVADRSSETQLQVGEKYLLLLFKKSKPASTPTSAEFISVVSQ